MSYHDEQVQQDILQNGTLEEVTAWLVWNDPNGCYTPEDCEAEDMEPMTLEGAREIMTMQIEEA